MDPQKEDSKYIKEYWGKIVSKAQFFFEQVLSRIKSFWIYIRNHRLRFVICTIGIPFALFLYQVFQTERIAEESGISFEKASKERQDGVDKVVKKIDELSKNSEPRPPDIKEVVKEAVKEALSEEKRHQKAQELNRQSLKAITKVTPPLKIFSEEPYSEFACFDYVVFHVVKEAKNEILFSNEQFNPVVIFSFTYNKENGEVNIKPEAIRFNEKNPKASYKNYLAYLLFIKAQFSNARLVFWNLIEDAPFIRTGPTIPVNMRYDHEGIKAVITFVSKMIRIEHFVGSKISFKLPPTRSVYQNVNYVYDALIGEFMQIGFKYEQELRNLKEKEWFQKHFWKLNLNGIMYRMEGESNIVEIYGVPIELGMWTIDFPESTVSPSLEEFRKDKSDDPVTVTIETKTRDKEIVLFFNTHRKRYNLSDPPLPLFPKHPLTSR